VNGAAASPVTERFDAVVIGAGLAGMMTALELAPLRVALVSSREIGVGGSSAWAQGGIAAAVGDDDSAALHTADTIAAGAGLVERRVAERLAAEGPRAIEQLAKLGVRFERDDDGFVLGREAAHSRRRILHAGGDATGAELVRALAEATRSAAHVTRFEGAHARELLVADGAVVGALVACDVAPGGFGTPLALIAPAVVLATGGLGGLYRFTTNPPESRGAGLALAARAGARLEDLEFVQFHPTALDVAADPLPLVTEALRGEGARLVDPAGNRIMDGIDSALELAPRDVVARRVFALRRSGVRSYLDARDLPIDLATRFPTVTAACARFGIDPRRDKIPVVAAAHYHMGGVAVDIDGRTDVAGLYACGEVAATGLHGANRLASNSLLESVVYPERIARAVRATAPASDAGLRDGARAALAALPAAARTGVVLGADVAMARLRQSMYADVGVERDATGLGRALIFARRLAAETADATVRDAATVATLVATAALRRCESRGSHQRSDFAATGGVPRHSFVTLGDAALGGAGLTEAAGLAEAAGLTEAAGLGEAVALGGAR